MKKVMLLALGDDYWTPLVWDMRDKLRIAGLESIIVTDNRLGEYQVFGGRKIERDTSVYYFSDFLLNIKDNEKLFVPRRAVPLSAVFADFTRLSTYGALDHIRRVNWPELVDDLTNFFHYVIDTENISLVFHEQVSTSFSYVCYEVCRTRQVPYIGIVGARISDRFEVRETIFDESDVVCKEYNAILDNKNPVSEEEATFFKDFMSFFDEQKPSYMVNNFLNKSNVSNYINRKKAISFIRKVKYAVAERRENRLALFREGVVKASMRSLRRNLVRIYTVKKFYRQNVRISMPELLDRNFILYPVHYQPEASTSIAAQFYVNQYEVIKNISFALPPNTYMVVKEHISALGYNTSEFYDKVRVLPNVILLGPEWNTKALIRASMAVVTLTSTVGMEAILMNKPVILFGRTFYEYHPLCHKFVSWGDFDKLLIRAIKYTPVELKYLEAFLISYYRYTKSGFIDYSKNCWNIGDELVKLIRDRINFDSTCASFEHPVIHKSL